jgi:hypothetical protein
LTKWYCSAWNSTKAAATQAASYFYLKTGNGTGLGVNDVKAGPVKVDVIQRDGKDVETTTKGMKKTDVSERGIKVGVGPIKVGLSRTTTQEEGQPPKTETVTGFSIGKFEGNNAQVGVGVGGCFIVCGKIEVGVQVDKVLHDLDQYMTNHPKDNSPDPAVEVPK